MKLAKIISKLETVSDVVILSGEYEKLMLELKRMCMQDDSILIETARCLMIDATSHRDLSIRLNALYLSNIFFLRSKLFRTILADSTATNLSSQSATKTPNYIQKLMVASGVAPIVTSDSSSALLTAEDKNHLKTVVGAVIMSWDKAYGKYYPELRAYSRFIRESLRMKLPSGELSINPMIDLLNHQEKREIFRQYQATLVTMKTNLKVYKSTCRSLAECSCLAEHTRSSSSSSHHQLMQDVAPNIVIDAKVKEAVSDRSKSGLVSTLRFLDRILTTQQPLASIESKKDVPVPVSEAILKKRAYGEVDEKSSVDEDQQDDNMDIAWVDDDEEDEVINHAPIAPYASSSSAVAAADSLSISTRQDIDSELVMQTVDRMRSHIRNKILPVVQGWRTSISAADQLFSAHKDCRQLHRVSQVLLKEASNLSARIDELLSLEP
jgi:hypothetical protein